MNDFNNPSQPQSLAMPPALWLAVLAVILFSLSQRLADDSSTGSSEPRPVITRAVQETFVFADLGIQVTPPPGWSCLWEETDRGRSRPTLVNESENCIVKLGSYRYRQWPPADVELETREYAHVTIDWFLLDDRLIGRLRDAPQDVTLMTMHMANKMNIPPALESLCNTITWLNENQS